MLGPPNKSVRSVSALSGSTGFSASAMKSSKVRQERNTNFKVVIRVRPPLQRELNNEIPFRNVVSIDEREQCITVSENLDAVLDSEGNLLANPGPYTTYSFMFDYCYDIYSNQAKVYDTTARSVVDNALQGYNATIFAYGQTGAGKTYTMEGFNRSGNVEERGIIPRAIEQIFNHIQTHAGPRIRYLVRASYLQIYNEQISDLLKPERNNLTIREDKKRGVYVDQLSEWVVRSPAEIYGLMERGASVRATGETKMNEMSSRSHAVFIVIAEQSETLYIDDRGQEMSPEAFQQFMHARGVRRDQEMNRLEDHVRQTFKVGKLNLVDLAGSERVNQSGATGQRLEESKQINKSLSMLGFVISALTEAKDRAHIPYRNSKLTRMLEDSLGGNCKTTMMAMISPAFEAMMETISTLKFANRAKNIRNEARVNEDLDQKSLLRKYERELKKLRAELEERSKNVVDKRRLLELDEQRRRAEADKIAAIKELEARSIEFLREKEEKKKLEQRIAMLTGQMLRGEKTSHPDGGNLGGGGGGGTETKQQQELLRQQYENKLADLERERDNIEEEKAQVDRYKQLLLKQRDIMIALTQRLVERDEQIMALQDELDAYDKHHKELEEKLDEKTALLIKFQRISAEVATASPSQHAELHQALASWSTDLSDHQQRDQWLRPLSTVNTGGAANGSTANGHHAAGNEGKGVRNASANGSTNSGTSKAISQPTEVDLEDDDNEDDVDDANIIVPPPPPPLDNHPSAGRGVYNNTGDARSTSERESVLQSQLAQQQTQIDTLEQRLAEARLTSTRIERVLHQEVETYLKSLSSETQRSQLQTPLKQVLQQTLQKLRDSQGIAKDTAASEREISALKEENAQLQRQLLVSQQQHHQQSEHIAEVSVLQGKCDTLVKEREAVQTIMEHKIKVLVQSVAQAAGSLLASLPPEANNMPATQALSKDVIALQRLVNASVAALRNAVNASQTSSTTPSGTNGNSTSNGHASSVNGTNNGGYSAGANPTAGGSGGMSLAAAMRASTTPSSSSSSTITPQSTAAAFNGAASGNYGGNARPPVGSGSSVSSGGGGQGMFSYPNAQTGSSNPPSSSMYGSSNGGRGVPAGNFAGPGPEGYLNSYQQQLRQVQQPSSYQAYLQQQQQSSHLNPQRQGQQLDQPLPEWD